MRKIWIFSYSTTVFRLLQKTWGFAFVQEKSEKPWKHGSFEYDTQDLEVTRDAAEMALIRATVEGLYAAPVSGNDQTQDQGKKGKGKVKGKGKASDEPTEEPAQEPTEEPAKPGSKDPKDPYADGKLLNLEMAEVTDSLREILEEEDVTEKDDALHLDDGDTARIRSTIPRHIRDKLKAEWIAAGKPTTFKDQHGKERKMVGKFFVRYRMKPFPSGFWFQHIIMDECQVVRNPNTGWSRAIRMIIRNAYQDREDRETNPASLMLVSATPAINQQSDYRGLASLI